jgi:hypothetical protein
MLIAAVGPDWEKAKTQAEVGLLSLIESGSPLINSRRQCLDYLFEIGVKMKLAGLETVLSA